MATVWIPSDRPHQVRSLSNVFIKTGFQFYVKHPAGLISYMKLLTVSKQYSSRAGAICPF